MLPLFILLGYVVLILLFIVRKNWVMYERSYLRNIKETMIKVNASFVLVVRIE